MSLLLFLAMGAEESSAAAELYPLNWSSADRTRKPFFPVYAGLIVPGLASWRAIGVIGKSGPHSRQGLVQHLMDSLF